MCQCVSNFNFLSRCPWSTGTGNARECVCLVPTAFHGQLEDFAFSPWFGEFWSSTDRGVFALPNLHFVLRATGTSGHSTHPWKNGEVVLYIAAPGSKKAVTKAQATEEVCPREGNHCQYADSLPATSTGSARMDRVRFWRWKREGSWELEEGVRENKKGRRVSASLWQRRWENTNGSGALLCSQIRRPVH